LSLAGWSRIPLCQRLFKTDDPAFSSIFPYRFSPVPRATLPPGFCRVIIKRFFRLFSLSGIFFPCIFSFDPDRSVSPPFGPPLLFIPLFFTLLPVSKSGSLMGCGELGWLGPASFSSSLQVIFYNSLFFFFSKRLFSPALFHFCFRFSGLSCF